ncbi:uncharacterized membrane protein YcaP (DUF421 family) [Virgibacillus natechei]|uniref:Uncharacterized membrane protein YcaP (DUF421 family) n=1 Tax=Virgibacillus natechei TaxID=1216297 RepID=A0ABS4IE92_9BACI|nr:hypothetical protein [Virgibacillus natechei]MBP1969173.1 uncharacterized membrane protein YcaP (DUF421 family) [Virgibacillus natechei]UZD14426.1 hypothetical protein OLD84_08000 [Virgibacillus natechei]
MILYIGKAILLYIITIIMIRLMGKSAFDQLTAHDLAGIFFVVTLAVSPLAAKDLTYSITGIIVIGLIHILFSKLINTLEGSSLQPARSLPLLAGYCLRFLLMQLKHYLTLA